MFWDINNAIQEGEFNAGNIGASSPTAIALSPDGQYLYIADKYDRCIYQVILTTPFDVTSATSTSSTTSTSSFYHGKKEVYGLSISADGSYLYVGSNYSSTQYIYQYSMTSCWDISTAQYSGKLFSFGDSRGISFAENGAKLYWVNDNGYIYQKDLTTPYDISTSANLKSINLSITYLGHVFISTDGSYAFTTQWYSSSIGIKRFSLSTKYDITTAVYDNMVFPINNYDSRSPGLWFKDDGSYMFTSSDLSSKVRAFFIYKEPPTFIPQVSIL